LINKEVGAQKLKNRQQCRLFFRGYLPLIFLLFSNSDRSSHNLMQLEKKIDSWKTCLEYSRHVLLVEVIICTLIIKINSSILPAGPGSKLFLTTYGNIAKKARKGVSKKGSASKETDDERNSTHSKNHSDIYLQKVNRIQIPIEKIMKRELWN
jgi:hypothetical protein